MKKMLLSFLLGICFMQSSFGQLGPNLIPNPGFESGTISSWSETYPSVGLCNWDSKVPNWKRGCQIGSYPGATPDLFQSGFASTVSIPVNKWSTNLPIRSGSPVGSKRYAGFSSGEPIICETGGVLLSGKYSFEVWIAGSGTYIDPTSVVAVLRSSSNLCASELLIMNTTNVVKDSWLRSALSITLTCAQAAMNYDRIEFRTNRIVFLDDVSLKRNTPVACSQYVSPVKAVTNVSSMYGPMPVSKFCNPVVIDGSCSAYESGYFIRVQEFDIANWSFLGTPLYNQWVNTCGEVPTGSISLNTLIGSSFNFTVGKTYMYCLTVGNGWYSETIKFFTVSDCLVTGLIQDPSSHSISNSNSEKSLGMQIMEDISSSISISPNPTNGKFNIDLNDVASEKVVVYNMLGKVVSETIVTENARSLDIDLTELPASIYMIHVHTGGEVILKKVIKN